MVHNAQMRRSTAELSPLALASFVMAILGFVVLPVVGAALAIVLGEMARRRISKTGEAGFAIATAGTILGALWFVLVLTAVLAMSLFVGLTHLR